jgi:REP element-mobilizing transposase RayT
MRSRTPRQLSFQGKGFDKPGDCFGGSLLKNSHAKSKRPLDSKMPIHLVLRANQSVLRLPKTFKIVNAQTERICKRHGVKLYRYANVGNHLHLLIKIRNVKSWAAFIRALTGRVAQLTSAMLKSSKKSFWNQRPFTRIVRGWNKAYRTIQDYIHLNQLEVEGFISRSEIKTLKDLRALVAGGFSSNTA